jgi:hypothetical protein
MVTPGIELGISICGDIELTVTVIAPAFHALVQANRTGMIVTGSHREIAALAESHPWQCLRKSPTP